LSRAEDKIRERVIADIRNRITTYDRELRSHEEGHEERGMAAREAICDWAYSDILLLLREYDRLMGMVADCDEYISRIHMLPTCNDCGSYKDCQIKPMWGDTVRFNCHLWTNQANTLNSARIN
jgi:hypothetical protein